MVSAKEIIEEAIERAITENGSDIHFVPSLNCIDLKIRIHGLLRPVATLPKQTLDEVIARIKILSNLRIDEHFLPQDGRFWFASKNELADIRVSIIPTFHGENAVLRVLTRKSSAASLESLGFNRTQTLYLRAVLAAPRGMILFSGPTGSGKTTTLYSVIELLKEKSRSIVTIEDPIEYSIHGVTQIQVENSRGLTFEKGLRSILRQDPDVIIVGEIRDLETANLAINASLSGHFVLSTVHSKSSTQALSRLEELGVRRDLIASSLQLIVSQRLIRVPCQSCIGPSSTSDLSLITCQDCKGLKIQGRRAIYELFSNDDSCAELTQSLDFVKAQTFPPNFESAWH